jgi:DNA-binding transcriptional LysR family regulator
VLERFLERRRIRRKIALITPHFLGVPFIVARSNLIATMPYAVARQFASMSTHLAVVIPPYEIPGFELRMHWHRRFDNEPRNRWLREQLFAVFAEDPSITLPPPYGRTGR